MKEFYDYLQRLPNRRAVDIVCAHPGHLRGRNLRNLTASGRFDKGFIFRICFPTCTQALSIQHRSNLRIAKSIKSLLIAWNDPLCRNSSAITPASYIQKIIKRAENREGIS